jgi:hypothetical protein
VFYAAAIYPAAAVAVTGAAQAWRGRHFCGVCGGSVYAVSGDEVEVHLGTLDRPGEFTPEYESWVVRREGWLPEFPGCVRYEGNREG